MGVSLGMRVAGLCVAGTVAVLAASCVAGEGGPPRGGGEASVAGGLSNGGPDGAVDRTAPSPEAAPSWRPDGSGGSTGVPAPAGSAPAPAAPGSPAPSPSSSPRSEPPGSSPGARPLTVPAWLPAGPDSPDTDGVADPQSLYDLLRSPDRCEEVLAALGPVPPSDDRRVLRGLAHGCLAVQGRGGSWETAARDHAELAGRPAGCKISAAYEVLGGLLEFHRRHPGATVRLAPAPGGATACTYGIAGVDAGSDGAARPGELVAIELRGTYFDHAELLREGSVSVGGVGVAGPLTAPAGTGDRLVLSVVVPAVPAAPGTAVAVRVRYGGTEVAREDAFTVATPDPVTPSASP
ncbi:hypothetical protein H0H10_10750 [Streptomyces sp. TRM S81-3]|uniref:Lipoprotein n=1 Tax=Streptomyces griseicoloratus TaxID=2752516 RepID=A0A926QQI3_9ACTN|nr:hypothetical protein [Streptomyces griseicoloratus]MBD0419635.1 hypothetical protein [Streptomyces griseicoloratus]